MKMNRHYTVLPQPGSIPIQGRNVAAAPELDAVPQHLPGRIVVVPFPVNVADIPHVVVHLLGHRFELLREALDAVDSLILVLRAGPNTRGFQTLDGLA